MAGDRHAARIAAQFGGMRHRPADGRGAIGTVGLDMNITPTWFARVDARYLRERADLRVDGAGQDVKLDPWTLGFGVGARF